jgi:hypothetical protein
MLVLTTFLLSGATAPQTCTTPPPQQSSHTGAEVAAIAIVAGVVVGTVILVEVHHSHHTIKGCVSAGQNGLQVQNDGDMKMYDLTGVTADVKVGDQVRVHGAKEKKTKGAADQIFVVEKMNKDYGPCKVSPKPPANTRAPAVTTTPATTPAP